MIKIICVCWCWLTRTNVLKKMDVKGKNIRKSKCLKVHYEQLMATHYSNMCLKRKGKEKVKEGTS